MPLFTKVKDFFTGKKTGNNSPSSDCEMFLKTELACQDVAKLGAGCFGIGYSLIPSKRIVNEEIAANANPVVVKVFCFGLDRLQHTICKQRLTVFENEVSNYSKNLAHENIVTFLGYFKLFWDKQSEGYIIENTLPYRNVPLSCDFILGGVVMEKMDSTLCTWTKANKITYLDDDLITAVFYQIGSALVYLHEKHSMTHCDLKSDNIGLSVIGPKRSVLQLKLLDFGNAKVHDPSEFVAAERHTEQFDLDSPECSNKITDFDYNQLLFGKNSFLDESRKFTTMLVRYATTKMGKPLPPPSKLAKDFESVKMKDLRLKRLLGRMLFKRLNMAKVMNYLGQ